MIENNHTISHNGDSHNNEDMKQNGQNIDLEGADQQPLEESKIAESDTSQRDPKLVYDVAFLSLLKKLNNHTGNMGWSQ